MGAPSCDGAPMVNHPGFDAHLLRREGVIHAGRYDERTRVKAVHLVTEDRDDYVSEWEAITTVAGGRWSSRSSGTPALNRAGGQAFMSSMRGTEVSASRSGSTGRPVRISC
jgi:hypothetical protein